MKKCRLTTASIGLPSASSEQRHLFLLFRTAFFEWMQSFLLVFFSSFIHLHLIKMWCSPPRHLPGSWCAHSTLWTQVRLTAPNVTHTWTASELWTPFIAAPFSEHQWHLMSPLFSISCTFFLCFVSHLDDLLLLLFCVTRNLSLRTHFMRWDSEAEQQ